MKRLGSLGLVGITSMALAHAGWAAPHGGGGAGFVGSAIVDQLLDAGEAEVRVLDNFVRGSRSNLATACEKGKVCVIESLRKQAGEAMRKLDQRFGYLG